MTRNKKAKTKLKKNQKGKGPTSPWIFQTQTEEQNQPNRPKRTGKTSICSTFATKNTPWATWTTTHFSIFSVLVQLTPFSSAIAVLYWKHYQDSAFSKAQFSVSQTVTPLFYTHSNNPLFGRGVHFSELTKIHNFTYVCSVFSLWNPPQSRKWPKLRALKIPFFEIIKSI